jgi:hypothetical protein
MISSHLLVTRRVILANFEAGFLACYDWHNLQLRHSAGLAPASTFTPLHPGSGYLKKLGFKCSDLKIPQAKISVNQYLFCPCFSTVPIAIRHKGLICHRRSDIAIVRLAWWQYDLFRGEIFVRDLAQ